MLKLYEIVVKGLTMPEEYQESIEEWIKSNPQVHFVLICLFFSTLMSVVLGLFNHIALFLKKHGIEAGFNDIGEIALYCAEIVIFLIQAQLMTVILFPVGLYLRLHLVIHWVLFVSYVIWTPFFLINNSVSARFFMGSLQTEFLSNAYPILKLVPNENRAFILKIWADVVSQTLKGEPLNAFSLVVGNIQLSPYSEQDKNTLFKNINHCMADFGELAPLHYGMCAGK